MCVVGALAWLFVQRERGCHDMINQAVVCVTVVLQCCRALRRAACLHNRELCDACVCACVGRVLHTSGLLLLAVAALWLFSMLGAVAASHSCSPSGCSCCMRPDVSYTTLVGSF